ncbi:hypothetical protein EXU57_08590 [Segetibacter sp. 3557_3]|uniref:hypothetical protein n=1 Tax=Segetibacter sp. 3557_3 TaxID=2547429 RepID=UPI001058DD6F|nr:hypothetical protein [Segetibacter sp. 3557_3]TDH26858.1 hypothetical protein EXU57_08590 [Segetibacter sp. 3557_3]
MADEPNSDELYSDDPEEQLRMENQVLKLKLLAELGGEFEQLNELDPEMENLFLKNVLEFEHKFAQSPSKTMYEILGKPDFRKSALLSDEEVVFALDEIVELLKQKNIEVDYEVWYPERQRYEFITEELFAHEASMMVMPGMTMHFVYEEFHPNHDYYIRRRAQQFCENWFERSFDEYSFELAPVINLPGHGPATREEFLTKMQQVFSSFQYFENGQYDIESITYDLKEEAVSTGMATGTVSYDGVLESGEILHTQGIFKIFVQMERGMWQICSFEWPGFGC